MPKDKFQLPTTPVKLPPDQRRLLDAMREAIEVGEGVRGDPLSKKITLRDLLDLGMVNLTGGRYGYTGGAAGRVGGVSGLVPTGAGTGAAQDLTPPPPPTGLAVNGALTSMILTWDTPTYGNHAYTEVWRAATDNLATAVKIGTAPVVGYVDPLDPGETYYYWIRHVTQAAVAGAYNDTVGTVGSTGESPASILETLAGAITESQFHTALTSRLNKIETTEAGLAQEITDRTTAIAAEASTRAAAITQEQSDRAAAIAAEASARTTAIAAEASARTTAINAEASARAAAITQEQSDRAAAISAESSARTAAINQEVLDRNAAINSAITQEVGDRDLAIGAAITQEVTDRNAAITSAVAAESAARGTAITAAITQEVTDRDAAITSAVSLESSNRTTAISAAIAQEVTDRDAAITTAVAAETAARGAAITSEQTARIAADNAISSDVTALDTRLTSAEGSITGNAGAISGLDSRVTTAEGAITSQASDITQLQSDLSAERYQPIFDGSMSALDDWIAWGNGAGRPEDVTPLSGGDFSLVDVGGTTVLQMTNAQAIYTRRAFPVSPSRTYRLRFRVRQTVDPTAGSNKVYAGVTNLDANYAHIATGPFTHCYFAVAAQPLTVADGWQVYEGEISGIGTGSEHNKFKAGVKYVRPMCLVNYSGGNGTVQVELLKFEDVTDAKERSDANAAAISGLDTRVTSAEGTITSQASDITQLQADVATAQSTADGAVSTANANTSAISGLDTRVTAAEGSITTHTSQITTLQSDVSTAQSTADGAVTSASANTSAISGLDTRVTAAEGSITTQSGQITTLQSDVSTAQTTADGAVSTANANTGAISALDTRVTAAEGSITSQSGQITQLQSDVSTAQTTADGAVTTSNSNASAISALDTRVTAAEGSITSQASDITQLQSDVSDMGRWSRTYLVSVSAAAELLGPDGSALPTTQGATGAYSRYVFTAVTQGTATQTQTVGEFAWNGSAWQVTILSTMGSSSNHPTFVVEGGAPKVKTFHASLYNVRVTGENTRLAGGQATGNASAISALDTRVTAAEGSITSQASDITSLQSNLASTDANVAANGSAISSLTTRVTQTESDITSIQSDSTLLNSSITLDASGALLGAGGGQVTIGGLGFSGDLNANYVTDTNQLADGAGLGQTANWSQINDDNGQRPADGAQVNAPSIAIKINVQDFAGTANPGEAVIHGFDDAGNPADVEGFITFNGQRVTVPRSYADALPSVSVITGSPAQGYLVFETAKTRPFLQHNGSYPRDVAFCKKQGGAWQYDNNIGWTTFTPTATMCVIGTMSTGVDNILGANIWGYGQNLEVVPEAGADVTADSTAFTNLESRVTATEGSITSHASDITSLQSSLATTDANVAANGSAISTLDSRVTATESSITSIQSDSTLLNSSITITASGQLQGGGGGQVTASGIGADPAGSAAAAQAAAESTAQSYTDTKSDAILSRGENLIINGNGTLNNNTNFNGFEYNGQDVPDGIAGSFSITSGSTTKFSDEFMLIDPTRRYVQKAWTKVTSGNSPRQYIGIAPYDRDKNVIVSEHHMYYSGTLTTLAQDLNPGDTVVRLTTLTSAWATNSTTNYRRRLIFWDYTNSQGYTYPPETYSRNNSGYDTWLSGGDIDVATGTITLASPWAGPAKPAGTPVSQSNQGGAYKYIASANSITQPEWTEYTGFIEGIDYSGVNITGKFPPGTAYVRLLFLLNREVTPNATTLLAGLTFNTEYETTAGAQAKADAAEQSAKDYADGKFVAATTWTADKAALQAQIDGSITTWFYSGAPTLSNEPAVNWTDDATKNVHLGDLYYDDATGFAYRFQLSASVYSWVRLADSDITAAMQAASLAQDTADSKRRVFVVQPVPPYDQGDLWDDGANGVKRCTVAKAAGGAYSAGDWATVANYVTDTNQLVDGAGLGQTADWSQITGVGKPADNADVTANSTAYTNLESRVTATEGSITSQASDITSLNTTVGNHSATLTQYGTSINGLEAQWAVKTDVNGRIAGFGLANYGSAATGGESIFEVVADKFAIFHPSATQNLVFGVSGGKTVMSGAYIEDATITSAKIDTLVADKITAGNITAAVTMTALSFNGGSMNIGSGQFTVDSFGNVDARSITIRDTQGNIILTSGAGISYNVLGDKPSSLSAINGGEGSKLAGIEAGATAGADWAANVTNQPGTAGNQFPNTEFPGNSLSPWVLGWNPNGIVVTVQAELAREPSGAWAPDGGNALVLYQAGRATSGSTYHGDELIATDVHPTGGWSNAVGIPVIPGKRYEFSARLAAHRCKGGMHMEFFDSAGTSLGAVSSDFDKVLKTGGRNLSSWDHEALFMVAPVGASCARFFFRKKNTWAGESDSYMWVAQPYFGEAAPNQVQPSPYVPGGARGALGTINQITPGNASTYIASAAIGYAQLGSASVGTLTIQDNAVVVAEYGSFDGNASLQATADTGASTNWGAWTPYHDFTVDLTDIKPGQPLITHFVDLFSQQAVEWSQNTQAPYTFYIEFRFIHVQSGIPLSGALAFSATADTAWRAITASLEHQTTVIPTPTNGLNTVRVEFRVRNSSVHTFTVSLRKGRVRYLADAGKT